MPAIKIEKRLNGVDVSRLQETIGNLRKDKDLAKFQFRVRNRWQGGPRNLSQIPDFHGAGQEIHHPKPFALQCDEPEVLLGGDQSPNPVEYLLHALAGCVTTAMVCHAAARGIRIDSLESCIEGDMDVRGFLGVADDVTPGYQNIRVTMRVKTDAPAEKLAELTKFSPVFSTIVNPTRVEVKVEKI